MPEYCKNCLTRSCCGTRDANNNTTPCVGGAYGGGNLNHTSSTSCHNHNNHGGMGNGSSGPSSYTSAATSARHIQVTAKVMFGSVQAISHMKMAEKAARENKRT